MIMARSMALMMTGSVAALLLLAARPAAAVMREGAAGTAGRGTQPAAAGTTAAVNREGFVQALDVAAQTIVINSTRYLIGAPQLALVDKRPKADGLLTLAGVKIGMYVRYRVEKTAGGDRVMEMWVLRDPQQRLGTKP
jgi:hypothetical protein